MENLNLQNYKDAIEELNITGQEKIQLLNFISSLKQNILNEITFKIETAKSSSLNIYENIDKKNYKLTYEAAKSIKRYDDILDFIKNELNL